MERLSDEDVGRIADAVVEKSRTDHESWMNIEPREHYHQHQQLSEFLGSWDEAVKSSKKVLFILVIAGIMALASIGMGSPDQISRIPGIK